MQGYANSEEKSPYVYGCLFPRREVCISLRSYATYLSISSTVASAWGLLLSKHTQASTVRLQSYCTVNWEEETCLNSLRLWGLNVQANENKMELIKKTVELANILNCLN